MDEFIEQKPTTHRPTEEKRTHLSQLLLVLPSRLRKTFIFMTIIFVITSFVLLAQINERVLVEVPRHGGELIEGIIGRPRFINPVIAKSDADRDMSQLIYSGLLRETTDCRARSCARGR